MRLKDIYKIGGKQFANRYSITSKDYNELISSIARIDTEAGYQIAIHLQNSAKGDSIISILTKMGFKPKNGFKNKDDKNKPKIELKYGGLVSDKKKRDADFILICDIQRMGAVVDVDKKNQNIGITENGSRITFSSKVEIEGVTDVEEVSDMVNQELTTTLMQNMQGAQQGKSSNNTAIILIAVVAVVAVFVLKRKNN